MIRALSRAAAFATAATFAACSGGSGFVAPAGTSPVTIAAVATIPATTVPKISFVELVMMENRDYDLIIGSSDAPYINKTLVPEAALMTNSHAIGHPSQPNYLAIFSGSTQGITDDSCPHTFSAVNLGSELLAKNSGAFDGFAESMPSNGYTGCDSGEYARKHAPWVNFTNVPAANSLVYRGFPAAPPSMSFIVPNLCNDMHDCTTQVGDTWLSKNLPPILAFNAAHDGLLILTWDEADPDANGKNQIATLLIGPMVKPGSYSQDITHYSVLHTMESALGVACTASACSAPTIGKIWKAARAAQ
jgi:acid phosphatase